MNRDNVGIKNKLTEFEQALVQKLIRPMGLIDVNSAKAVKDVENRITGVLENVSNENKYTSMIVVCLGASLTEICGECVGPLIGSELKEKGHIEGVYIYGTMEDPIDGLNYEQRINQLDRKHKSPLVISVTCGISDYKWKMGCISVRKEVVSIHSDEGGKCTNIGKVAVTPILIHRERKDIEMDMYLKLISADTDRVNKMAEVTADGLHNALRNATEQGMLSKKYGILPML